MDPDTSRSRTTERIATLDVLRGLALLGMFIVHVWFFARGGGGLGVVVNQIATLFLQQKARATFGILFGVGFSLMLERGGHGAAVHVMLFRRLLGLGVIGFVAEGVFGFATLMGYAVSGLWLLLVHRWSTRVLIPLTLICMMLGGLWNVTVGSVQWVAVGVEQAREMDARTPEPNKIQLAGERVEAASEGTSFRALVAARMTLFYYAWTALLPHEDELGVVLRSLAGEPFMWFLIGLIAVRLQVFDQPREHRRLIVIVMILGAASWAIGQFALYKLLWPALPVIPVARIARPFYEFFGVPDGKHLALTYVGAVVLIMDGSPIAARWLTEIFGWAGRLALTNYMIHVALLSLLFDRPAFGVNPLTPQAAPIAGMTLFVVLALASRAWLQRFRLGPLEWVLRSITYGHLQPFKRRKAEAVP